MTEPTDLGELEQLLLWAIQRFDGDAYGPRILEELDERVDRRLPPSALYGTLDRLESKGMIRSRLGDAGPERGGRPKRYVIVTAKGRASLERVGSEPLGLREGVDLPLEHGG